MKNKWLKISLLLVTIGFVLLVVYWTVYLPKLTAYQHAILAWGTGANHSVPPPSPLLFGLDASTWIIINTLGIASSLLLFLGFGYIVLYLITKVLKSLGYPR
jgi:hypothetical protein